MISQPLNSLHQELTLYDLVEMFKQSAREEANEPEFEPKERITEGFELTEWLGLTETGIKVFVDNDWNEKGVAATGQGIMGMLA